MTKLLYKLYYILITSRPTTSIIPAIIVFIILLSHDINIKLSIWCGFLFMLITMYGFIINDIFDYKKDKIANRKRPIAEGKVSIRFAVFFLVILTILIFSIEYFFGRESSLLVVVFTIILLTIYSFVSKTFPIFKGLVTSVLTITPMYYANVLVSVDYHFSVYLLVICYIFGRELYMDAQDYKGDILSNLKTIPYYLGIKWSKYLGVIIMFLTTISIVLYSMWWYKASLLTLWSILSVLLMLISIYLFIKDEEKAIFTTKINMIFLIVPLFNIAI